MEITFLGATREVTGSCFLFSVNGRRFAVDCGLIQGSAEHERHNREPFGFDGRGLDAVVLTHAHLDHAGRLPLLVKRGFRGFIYTHRATAELVRLMLEDAAYLEAKETEQENRYRARAGKPRLEPLYTLDEVLTVSRHFNPLNYGETVEVVPGARVTLHDAGHILGSAIVELDLEEGGLHRKIVLSGDLGHAGAPILRDPAVLHEADAVILESTYGDRCHRPWAETWKEMGEIIRGARAAQGNILVPAFAVGRAQELLYVLGRHYDEWGLKDWTIFLDSPLAIEATDIYRRYAPIYDPQAAHVHAQGGDVFHLPKLYYTRTAEESMRINTIRSGALIIAGSGMMTGGRIVHHLKRNLDRVQCHVIVVGFQAAGTRGRALVDGAKSLRLFGDEVQVLAQVHTVGGLSAHADQAGLAQWYAAFRHRPPVWLVHGEPRAMEALSGHLRERFGACVHSPVFGERVDLAAL